MRWRRHFPGEPVQLRATRKWLEDLLPPCTARADVIAVASELAANAVRHTASGRGGQFSVEVAWSAETLRLTVGDGGAPTWPVVVEEPDEEHGRGLLLVQALSQAVDVFGDASGRLVAARLPWAANGGPAPDFQHETYAGIASLQASFPGMPVWFGWASRQWWAMTETANGDRLMCARSAAEMAALLARLREAIPFGGRDLRHAVAASMPMRNGR